MFKTAIILFVALSINLFAQTETHRWKGKELSYQIPVRTEEPKQNNNFLSLLKSGYKFLISDYDGDNCPFTPSCSQFFVDAAKKTNILQGFLMFADRFTRDLNYFNRKNYPKLKNGKLYDTPEKYILR